MISCSKIGGEFSLGGSKKGKKNNRNAQTQHKTQPHNIQHNTSTTSSSHHHPAAFPSLSVGRAATPLNHGAAPPQYHAQAASHWACIHCHWFACLGGRKKRDQKIEGRGHKCGRHFANTCNNPIRVGLGNGGF